MFVLHSARRHEDVRVHVGWCEHDRGLWASVEFVDADTNAARCAEPVHDDTALARAPELRLAGCPFPHVKDWELLTDPASDTSVPSDLAWTTPAAGSAHLARCRTFSVLDRTVRLRLSRETSRDPAMAGRMVCDDVWVLEVDFPVVWRTDIPAIPPPRRVEPAALPYKEKTPSSSSSERSGRSWKRLVPKLLARG